MISFLKTAIKIPIFYIFAFLLLGYAVNLGLAKLGYEYSYVYLIYFFILSVFVLLTIKLDFLKNLPISIFLYLILNFFSIIWSFFDRFYIEGFLFYIDVVLLPFLIFSCLIQSCSKYGSEVLYIPIFYFLIKTSLYLILMPIEQVIYNKAGYANMQFTGGQYNNIALLFLILAFLYKYEFSNKNIIYLAYFILVLTVLLSFSRVGLLLLLFTFFHNFIRNTKIYLFFLFLIFILLFVYTNSNALLNTDNDFLKYWTFRLNLNSDSEIEIDQIFGKTTDDERSKFISLAIKNVNLLDIILGYGIGSTQEFLNTISLGQYQYGSLHNLFITILIERGILFFIFSLIILFYLIFSHSYSMSSKLYLLLFFVFSITTGAELFVNARDFNIDISIIIFMLFLPNRLMFKKSNLGILR